MLADFPGIAPRMHAAHAQAIEPSLRSLRAEMSNNYHTISISHQHRLALEGIFSEMAGLVAAALDEVHAGARGPCRH